MKKEKDLRLGDIVEYEETDSEYADVGWGLHRGVKVDSPLSDHCQRKLS